MATDMVLDFYESINFELIDIDGYDTLFTELLEDGTYATVSDDDGYMPEDLETQSYSMCTTITTPSNGVLPLMTLTN